MSDCQTISAKECQALCKNNQNIKIIDIRGEDDYKREHLEGSCNKQLTNLSAKDFDQDDIVLFYCQLGNRTKQAEGLIKSLGIKNSYILEGGITAWKKINLPTIVNRKAPFPINRQVQIVVGFMVLLGIILAYTVSPYFNLLSAFFGAGLLFAGLSGTCALANFLMFLPFNRSKDL